MRGRRRDGRGISEIVGALMLVLIVVVAATALAVFVAQYQKQLQAEQALTHDRQLEDLAVLHVAPGAVASMRYTSLNITIASLYISPSTVDEITINDQPLRNYTVWELNLENGNFTSFPVCGHCNATQLTLNETEQVNMFVTLNQSSPAFSFYNPAFGISVADSVKVDLFTGLQNDFTRVFVPPTAIGFVEPLATFNGSAYVTIPVLDGSSSFQAGNSSIVQWNWTVTALSHATLNFSGEKAVLNVTAPPVVTYDILLQVTDTEGLVGVYLLPPYTT